MTTLKRTKPITVSPVAQAAHELEQLREQVKRLMDSLTDESAGRQTAIREASELRAELASETRCAKQYHDQWQAALQSRKRLVSLVGKWRTWYFQLTREHSRQFKRADALEKELAQMSAALETAETDALELAKALDFVVNAALEAESSYMLEIKLHSRMHYLEQNYDAIAKKYLDRERTLRQHLAESVANTTPEQVEVGLKRLYEAVIGSGEGE